ncbi:MAG: hypothetical protein N2447_06545 [Thermoanaerobaculum sp.]|nr:hypothetical protein [Thermoanaerobaculum sp.]
MSGGLAEPHEALQAAAAVLAGRCEVFEVFVRRSVSLRLAHHRRGELCREESYELGVACRAGKGQLIGFGRASGEAKEAGQAAARLALQSLTDGHPTLPLASLLGAVPCPPPPALSEEEISQLFHRLRQANDARDLALTWLRARTLLARSEGFEAFWENQLVLWEWSQEMFGEEVMFRRVASQPAQLGPPSCLSLVSAQQPLPPLALEPGLRRVLLAPDVAAPLLLGVALRNPKKTHPAGAWDLWDVRRGAHALLPMGCDGEGLPACNLPVLTVDRAETQPSRWGAHRHGTVRVPWDSPPTPGPVHLWQKPFPGPATPPGSFSGLAALAPLSEVVWEQQRFRLLAAAVELSRGGVVAAGVVTLVGSLSRLVSGLLTTLGPAEHVALGCPVSTPWLVVANLEVR